MFGGRSVEGSLDEDVPQASPPQCRRHFRVDKHDRGRPPVVDENGGLALDRQLEPVGSPVVDNVWCRHGALTLHERGVDEVTDSLHVFSDNLVGERCA